jgi:mRNA-degrading endonuclease HigB of HigAB toxin-antitoxin module
MNSKFIVFLVFLVFISIAGVSAVDDVNQTDSDSNFVLSDSESGSLAVQEESVSAVDDVDQTDSDSTFSRVDSECCSFIIQEENETVFAFRQDAPVNGRGVVIHNESLGDMEVIVQEIDSPTNHFIHAVITEDGWVFGHGGDSSNVSDTIHIEHLAFEMLTSKVISNESIHEIQKIFQGDLYGYYGHVVIKAPNGTYAIAYGDKCIFGTLKPGEFLVVPNMYVGFRTGNYSDYGMNPVDAIVEICSYENTGTNRRNLYSYDYKAHHTANGQKYGVDIYVTNDNGHNVGLNTSKIVTYFYFNDARYQQSVIPQNPDKLQIATHIFEKQSIDSNIEVVSSPYIVHVINTTSARYRINNIVDEKTVVFDLEGDNVEFVKAVAFQGNCSISEDNKHLYWDLPASDTSKEIILSVFPKAKGNYTIKAHIEGIGEYVNETHYAVNPVAIFKVEDVTTYKSYFKSMIVYLTDEDGVPYIGERVSITVNGNTYYRKVTPNGYATFAINLQPGEYDATIYYGADYYDNETTSKIIVKKTLFSQDLVVAYEAESDFEVCCLDENGNPLEKCEVDFYFLDGMRVRVTDNQGIGSLYITRYHPDVGKYPIITFNTRTNEFVTNWLYVIDPKTELVANEVTATYDINKDLVITLKDSDGKALSGVNVTVNLNGAKSYTTDKNGQVKINVANLVPNTYSAKITFAGNDLYNSSATSAKVIVKKATSKITAQKATFKAKKAKKYTITLKANNKAIKNAKVILKVKGKTYKATTNAKGKATFKITKLTKKGKYTATVKFNGDKYYLKSTKSVKIVVK